MISKLSNQTGSHPGTLVPSRIVTRPAGLFRYSVSVAVDPSNGEEFSGGPRSRGLKGNVGRISCLPAGGRCLRVGGASVANVDDLVGHRVAANCSAGIDGVHMVDAAADGVLLDDTNAHFGGVVGGVRGLVVAAATH